MDTNIQTIHCTIAEEYHKIIEAKLSKLLFADSILVDVRFVITQEHNEYSLECKLHFRGGISIVIKDDGYDLRDTIDSLMHKVVRRVRREKDKKKEH